MARLLQNLMIHRVFDREFLPLAEQYFHGRLVDIGCGTKPYREPLERLVTEHVGVDLPEGVHGQDSVDLTGTAYTIPAESESFDSALCTAVLEHLEEPELALRECFRVLRAGGVAIYSAPLIWHVHEEPRDFFRYTEFGLRYLFEKSGFEIVELKALSGFWLTFGTMLSYNVYRFDHGILRALRLTPLLSLSIQHTAMLLERLDRTEEWTWMYIVVARKPDRVSVS